jgi:hypothetical protein
MTYIRPHLALAILVLSATAYSDVDSDINLKGIMQDLQSDAALIVEGLLIGNFTGIEDAAARIAEHPQIPASQVALVATELGSEMPAFKQFDTEVHELALSISAAAREADAASIADNYKRMLDACLACHVSYRQRVAQALSAN